MAALVLAQFVCSRSSSGGEGRVSDNTSVGLHNGSQRTFQARILAHNDIAITQPIED